MQVILQLSKVDESQQAYDYLREVADAVENGAKSSPLNTGVRVLASLLEVVVLDLEEDIGHDVLGQHQEHQHDTVVVVTQPEVQDRILTLLSDSFAVLEAIRPGFVQQVEEDDEHDLHLDDGLSMVDDGLVLHHVQGIGLTDTLSVQVLLGDSADDVPLDPAGGFLQSHVSSVSDLFEALTVQVHLDLDVRVHWDESLLVDIVVLGKGYTQVNHRGYLVGHQSHVNRLEVLPNVGSHLDESGFDHVEQHGGHEQGVDHNLDEDELKAATLELVEVVLRALLTEEPLVFGFRLANCFALGSRICSGSIFAKVPYQDDGCPLQGHHEAEDIEGDAKHL